MAQYELNVERLELLIVEAKIAHSKFERKMGRTDNEWPIWYAHYIMKKLDEQ
ncbi:hypothetical protein K8R43_02110 [archaeon]|nr:hypothetical protein [archaeon]